MSAQPSSIPTVGAPQSQGSTSAPSTGHACGKVILLGEHAVVHGVAALAVGIDRGAEATATVSTRGTASKSVLEVPAWGLVVDDAEEGPRTDLALAFAAIVKATRALAGTLPHRGPVRVSAHADLPPGGGLGCSAALGVAIARALAPRAEAAHVAELATAWERVFHGNPSGVDAAVAAYGGALVFRRGAPLERVPLPAPLTVCLGSTGLASSTKSMVEGVARLRERRPEMVEKAFAGIGSLVSNARLALEAGDLVGLGKLMDLNQMVLSGLFLSTEELERLCGTARDAGALGAKLTGAGGGGCVVALPADRASAGRIIDGWATAGFSGFSATVDATGEVLP